MGYNNKAFSLYFDKLRRNYERYHAARHPMQVPFLHDYSDVFERLRRHNSLLPAIEGQTIACKVMAVGTYQPGCIVTVRWSAHMPIAHTDKYRDLLWFDTGFKFHAKFYMRQLKLEDVMATKDGPVQPDSPAKVEWEVGDVVHFVVKVRLFCVGGCTVPDDKRPATQNITTPFYEMDLEPVSRHQTAHSIREVMQELTMKHATREVVMGRVLNEMQRGYAVGIAGMTFCVDFLVSSGCLHPHNARRCCVLPAQCVQPTDRAANWCAAALLCQEPAWCRARDGGAGRCQDCAIHSPCAVPSVGLTSAFIDGASEPWLSCQQHLGWWW